MFLLSLELNLETRSFFITSASSSEENCNRDNLIKNKVKQKFNLIIRKSFFYEYAA